MFKTLHLYPCAQASRVIGERAKRARRSLVMFMETRDIIYSILHILTIVFPDTRTVEYQP